MAKWEALRTLRFKTKSGTVLFGLGENGVSPLPKGTPAVWVMGPTFEDEEIGFAACAMFDVDPGRGRLSANADRNLSLAQEVGRELGARLKALREVPWDRLREDLGFASGVGEYEFWSSVWSLFLRVIGRPDGASRRIMTRVLEVALKGLASELPIVPNGLGGALRRLTTSKAVTYKLSGALANVDCISTLFDWPVWVNRRYLPEAVVAPSIADGLKRLESSELTAVSLTTVVSWLQNQLVRPEEAGILGSVLQTIPGPDDRNQETTRDMEGAKRELGSVLFYSQAGSPARARDLLVLGQKGDEGSRALFAPLHHRLRDEYDLKGVEFFRFCRGAMNASPSEMAGWIRQAEEVPARRAALEYLLGGEQALEVRRQIRTQGIRGTWLDHLSEDDPWMSGLSQELQDDLRSPIVQVRAEATAIWTPRRDPGSTLQRAAIWWRDNRSNRLRDYDRRVYPNGKVPKLAFPVLDNSIRSEWMVLFGRAAFYRLGRARDEQHRAFMEYAQRKGFWKVFATKNPNERADEWMEVLEQFCDEQVDTETWEHWMRSFPHFYKLSRWLDGYAEMFLDLDRQVSRYDLRLALTPRSDATYQGGGIDVPPHHFGIGANFVVRELLRHGHLKNEFAHEHAFVPTAAVRGLLRQIGLQVDNCANVDVSAEIYKQVAEYLGPEQATFDGAFDIPFQLIAEDPELQFRLIEGA